MRSGYWPCLRMTPELLSRFIGLFGMGKLNVGRVRVNGLVPVQLPCVSSRPLTSPDLNFAMLIWGLGRSRMLTSQQGYGYTKQVRTMFMRIAFGRLPSSMEYSSLH